MNRVFRHKPTGDLYGITGGDLSHHIGLDGERFYELRPVSRLVDEATREPITPDAQGTGSYVLLVENFSFTLSVSQAQLEQHFEEVAGVLDAGNSTLEEVLREYRHERCDFTDIDWCVEVALTSAQNMGDGLTRCVLHTLAEHVKAQRAMAAPGGN